jgi:hypothetical protein
MSLATLGICQNGVGSPYIPEPEEEPIVTALYAYFDESGHYGQHPYVIFAGLVSGFQPWTESQNQWLKELRAAGLTAWDTKLALRHSQPYGNLKRSNPEQRLSEVLPFVRAITDYIELGVSVAVDVVAYKKAPQRLRRKYGPDPHYFAFEQAIRYILNHWQIPRKYSIGLICDDHEVRAMRCYKLLRTLKRRHLEIRQRITSICFSDDKDNFPLQSADLFAHVARLEAESRFRGKPNPYNDSLKRAFEYVNPATGAHLHFEGGVFGDEELRGADAIISLEE